MISEDDEKRYGLRPLPEIPFIGLEESRKRNAIYEDARHLYRLKHPHKERVDET